jgi:hypothetical protein
MIKPFIDLGGEAIVLLTTALGRLLLGVDEPNPQARCPGISNLPPGGRFPQSSASGKGPAFRQWHGTGPSPVQRWP